MGRARVDQVLQIGIIVRDAKEAAGRYQELLGIGQWNFNEVDTELGLGRHFRTADGPVNVKALIAWTTLGSVELELIEPRDRDSIYARFLREQGPGIHHLMFSTPNFDDTSEALQDAGLAMAVAGEFQETRFQLLDGREELGLILEIATGGPLVPDRRQPK
jgi:4-hydroxyphenylpyruvate dioxygenase-like putative hemolysin